MGFLPLSLPSWKCRMKVEENNWLHLFQLFTEEFSIFCLHSSSSLLVVLFPSLPSTLSLENPVYAFQILPISPVISTSLKVCFVNRAQSNFTSSFPYLFASLPFVPFSVLWPVLQWTFSHTLHIHIRKQKTNILTRICINILHTTIKINQEQQ